MRLLTMFLLLVAVTASAKAQENAGRLKPIFRSSFAVALINGSASTSCNIETVHGFSLNKSFAGVGLNSNCLREGVNREGGS